MKTATPRAFLPSLILLTFFSMGTPGQPAAQQSGGNTSDKEKKLADLARTTAGWMSGKGTTPGISVEMRELKRSTDTGHLIVQYHVFVTGAPKDKTYTLVTWPINAITASEQIKGLSLGDDGMVICAGRKAGQCGDPNKKDDPVEFTFGPVPGEIFRLALASADAKIKIYFFAIPDPLTNTSGKCSVEAIRLLPGFEMALIRAKGFQPNEELGYFDKSVDEVIDHKIKADGNGEYISMLLPGVIGHDGGSENVKITGVGCAPEVSFRWGK